MPLARQRIQNVPTVELSGGKQVERGSEESYPGRPADGSQEKGTVRNPRPQASLQEPLDERPAERHRRLRSSNGNYFRCGDGCRERRHGDQEADQRSGQSHVKKSASVNDGGADANKRTQRADQRGRGQKERVGGMDSVVAAGKEVAQFVSQEDAQ